MKVVRPKGILVPIGGGNDDDIIMQRIIKESGKKHPKICYITLAISDAEEAKNKHKRFARQFGAKYVSFIHYNLRSEADSDANIQKIKECEVILIGGGNQLRLSSLLGGTALLAEMKNRYYEEEKFIVAGSSAGAAAMSNTMIISGSSQDALIKGELQLTNGLDLINNVFIDTHFTERGRFGRVIQTVAYNPGVLGLGISADTGVMIYQGERLEVVGKGLVVIVDGTGIEYSDLLESRDGDPLTIVGLKMHIIGPGKFFVLSTRKVQVIDPANSGKPTDV
jgi:cyanophycinase